MGEQHRAKERRDTATSLGLPATTRSSKRQRGILPESLQGEWRPAGTLTLILDLWPPEQRENKLVIIRPLGLRSFVFAALGDKYRGHPEGAFGEELTTSFSLHKYKQLGIRIQ